MREYNLSTKEILRDIKAMKGKALELVEKSKPYSDFLRFILTNDFFNEEATMPSLKQLAEIAGLNYGKIRKYIQDIYQDLVIDDEMRPVFSFPTLRYEFLIWGWRRNRFLCMEVDRLPVMPRVGEEVTLPFFSAYFGTKYFHVEEIKYEFEEETQVVQIWLRAGSYNSYWRYRKDKAMEENELSVMDFLNLEEHELKAKLKVGGYS